MKIYLIAAKRTPISSFNGFAYDIPASDLGGRALRAAAKTIPGGSEYTSAPIFMGCVLTAGLGQNPARQAALNAGFSYENMTVTINHMCGSGLTAVVQAYNMIRSGNAEIAFAGGMENMTRTPYLLTQARAGSKLGHKEMFDHLMRDGLEDVYSHQTMLGLADSLSQKLKISRETQEAWARQTFYKALEAQNSGFFEAEIVPLNKHISNDQGSCLSFDEHLLKVKPKKFELLHTVLPGGVITPATSSPLADGAAALALSTAQFATTHDWPLLARIAGYAYVGGPSELFAQAPVRAIGKLCSQLDWDIDTVDLFEINEAFALVPILVQQAYKIPTDKINIAGGACSLGHPLGCSGARIIVTLVHNMIRCKAKRAIAAICIGGGEGAAIALERE